MRVEAVIHHRDRLDAEILVGRTVLVSGGVDHDMSQFIRTRHRASDPTLGPFQSAGTAKARKDIIQPRVSQGIARTEQGASIIILNVSDRDAILAAVTAFEIHLNLDLIGVGMQVAMEIGVVTTAGGEGAIVEIRDRKIDLNGMGRDFVSDHAAKREWARIVSAVSVYQASGDGGAVCHGPGVIASDAVDCGPV